MYNTQNTPEILKMPLPPFPPNFVSKNCSWVATSLCAKFSPIDQNCPKYVTQKPSSVFWALDISQIVTSQHEKLQPNWSRNDHALPSKMATKLQLLPPKHSCIFKTNFSCIVISQHANKILARSVESHKVAKKQQQPCDPPKPQ